MSTATTAVQALDTGLDTEQIRTLVRERSTLTRVRGLLGREEAVEFEREVYWPIALIYATARSTGRRTWVERVQGAVDLVSGRIGLIDVDLPPSSGVSVDDADLIEARLSRSGALAAWHEFFRDHVDRRRKPMRPPALSVDRVERLWLRNNLVSAGGHLFLVDPMLARVEDLKSFPHVEQMLAEPFRHSELSS